MASTKQAYLSPSTGLLDITVIRDARPSATISLDLGIPNFTVFSIKFPLVEDKPNSMSELVAEAVHTLLDEMAAFMISMKFEEKIIVGIYATVLQCFKGMTGEADTNKSQSAISKDPTVKTFEGTFKLPMAFVNETQEKVVTAAGKVLKRPPVHRHLEMTYEKPQKTTVNDARTVIRNYRNRSLKTQPGPMYIVVYDQNGNARGTIPVGNGFKNQLLNQFYKKKASKVEFSPTVKFDNDIEMKTTNAEGIPKSVFVGDEQYTPVAIISDDMALYSNEKDEYLVKFSDGRCVAFGDYPEVTTLKDENYPVPTEYEDWEPLPENKTPESSDENEAVDERGVEVIEGTEVESNPISDLKPDDEKNEQLEEGEVNDKRETGAHQGPTPIMGAAHKDNGHYECECGGAEYDQDQNCKGCGKYKYDASHWVGSGGGASGILPICVTTGRICLGWRSGAVHEGNCWGTIGGAIQAKMTPAQSAQKELKEETGYGGGIRLIPAFVFTSGNFKYHNFIGLVPSEFGLHPMAGGSDTLKFKDETDAIAWFSWPDLQKDIVENPGDYHSGVLKLLQQSGDQIQKICAAASNSSSEE